MKKFKHIIYCTGTLSQNKYLKIRRCKQSFTVAEIIAYFAHYSCINLSIFVALQLSAKVNNNNYQRKRMVKQIDHRWSHDNVELTLNYGSSWPYYNVWRRKLKQVFTFPLCCFFKEWSSNVTSIMLRFDPVNVILNYYVTLLAGVS